MPLGALFAASLALGCAEAKPEAPAEARVLISVDGTQPGAALDPIWAFHGFDEVNYTTSEAGRALLEVLAETHPVAPHIRNHFLFNTGDGTPRPKWGSTNVYTEDAAGTPVYDWALTDRILDALTDAGTLPFVELGFMPQALSPRPAPYETAGGIVLNGGSFYPPTDYAKWAALVNTWAAHVDARYPGVAADWLWELWNEPDSGYFRGSFEEYTQLYDYTERALHDVLPEAQLGGPAVIGAAGSFLPRFLDHCDSGTNSVTGEAGTRLDLVTFHAKGGVSVDGEQVRLDLGNQLRLHRAGFEAVAERPSFAQTPIYITEADPDGCAACSPDLIAGAAYRTSSAYGAYEVAMMKRSLELAAEVGVQLKGVLTWAFTFPESGYFQGFRELATHGIQLPVLSAFSLLGQLVGARLPLASSGARGLTDLLEQGVQGDPDIDGLAALDGRTLRVLVWSYQDLLATALPRAVRLNVDLPRTFGTRVRISHRRVDDEHGNAFTAWLEQGSPESPTPSQRAALQQAMVPVELSPDDTLDVNDSGALSLDFELPPFGISLITLTPLSGD